MFNEKCQQHEKRKEAFSIQPLRRGQLSFLNLGWIYYDLELLKTGMIYMSILN